MLAAPGGFSCRAVCSARAASLTIRVPCSDGELSVLGVDAEVCLRPVCCAGLMVAGHGILLQ